MEATTEATPDTEMVNAPFEVTAPVALQEQFSPFEDVSPTAELPKVISFFADLNCGFSSKYVVIFLEQEVCGLNNLCFLYWKVIQNLFLFQLEP